MSSDEKKVVKLDEKKGEQKSIKPNEKEEEIGLLSSKPMLMSKSRQTQKYFHRKRPLLAPLLALEVLISNNLFFRRFGSNCVLFLLNAQRLKVCDSQNPKPLRTGHGSNSSFSFKYPQGKRSFLSSFMDLQEMF